MADTAPQPDPALDQERVLDAYRDGVRAFGHLAAKTVDWAVPTPCAGWTLLELAGHTLCIARYYHRLLNAATEGRPLDRLPRGEDLAAFNASELIALGPLPGPQRVIAFDAVAGRYGERLTEVDWDLTIGSWDGAGSRSIGEHTLLAVGEWHLHAWDVACSFGWDYRPDDAEVVAAGRALLPGWSAASWGDGGDPWEASLASAGRRH